MDEGVLLHCEPVVDKDGLRFYVLCFANGTLREVCVMWELNLPRLCDSEIVGLSLILAIPPVGQSPVCLQGFSSNLKSLLCIDRVVFVAEYLPKVVKEHVQEAGKNGSSALDCFALLHIAPTSCIESVLDAWTCDIAATYSTTAYSFRFSQCCS